MKKTKPIAKPMVKKGRPAKKGGVAKMREEEAELDRLIGLLDFRRKEEEHGGIQQDDIDSEI
jgi:hypothetical protein